MTKASLALATLALAVTAGPAAAEPPLTSGDCRFSGVINPFDRTRYVGEVDSGPVVIATTGGPRTGRVVCSIKVNDDRHSAPDAARLSSPTTTGVVMLHPTPVELPAGDDSVLILCTSVEIVGEGTYYWYPSANAWTTSPATSCATPT